MVPVIRLLILLMTIDEEQWTLINGKSDFNHCRNRRSSWLIVAEVFFSSYILYWSYRWSLFVGPDWLQAPRGDEVDASDVRVRRRREELGNEVGPDQEIEVYRDGHVRAPLPYFANVRAARHVLVLARLQKFNQ